MKPRISIILFMIGGVMLLLGLAGTVVLSSSTQITLEVVSSGAFQYTFKGTALPNEYLGLVKFDGVNTWNLVTTTYATDDGTYNFGAIAFPSTTEGETVSFRVHNYGVSSVSNTVSFVVGETLAPTDPYDSDPIPPDSYDDPDFARVDTPNYATPLTLLGAGTSGLGLIALVLEKKK